MRTLSKKQKRLLTDWANANKDKIKIAFDIEHDPFPFDLYEQLEIINDYETLVQDINRFVSDLAAESMFGH